MPEDNKTTGTAQTGPEATSEKGANTENPTEAQKPQTDKKYTDDDVKKLLQTEADRRVSEAQKKWQKQLDDMKKELELSKLTENERLEAEKKAKEEEITKREKEIARKELDFKTLEYLTEKKADKDLMKAVEGVAEFDERKKVIDYILKRVDEMTTERVKQLESGTFQQKPTQTPPLPNDPKEAVKAIFAQRKK